MIRFVHFPVPAHLPYTDNQYHIAEFGERELRTPCGINVLRIEKRPIKEFNRAPDDLVCCPMCADRQKKYFGESVADVKPSQHRQKKMGRIY